MSRGYEEALEVIRTLRSHGFPAYLVGGCVRDRLAGRAVKDYDIATAALPEQVSQLFARTIPTGLQHGTVTVMVNNIPLEVTTFRIEDRYEDHRRPQSVKFVVDLEADLQRRDFTINAMASDEDGLIFDPFGGQGDLEEGILRAVGQAKQRFSEDALRMVRCIRFAAEYELEIEAQTWGALLEQRPLLQHIAMERIREEWDRMLRGQHPARAIRLLISSGLLEHLKEPLPITSNEWQTMLVDSLIHNIARLNDQERWLRWTWVLQAVCDNEEQVNMSLSCLRFSGEDRHQILSCYRIGLHLFRSEDGFITTGTDEDEANAQLFWKKRWYRAILVEGRQAARDWLAMYDEVKDDHDWIPRLKWSHEGFQWIMSHGSQWEIELQAATIKELQITGKTLQQLGMTTGPQIGQTLQALLQAVVWDNLPNDGEHLYQQVEKWQLSNKEEEGNDV